MSIQHIDKLFIFFMKKRFADTTYGQVVYMWSLLVVYICHIDKYISYDTEQVYNEYIYMTYLRNRNMNISPTLHNISFTECQNLP